MLNETAADDGLKKSFMHEVVDKMMSSVVHNEENEELIKNLEMEESLQRAYLKKNSWTNEDWPNDAAGGKLSYSKMVFEYNKSHYVTVDEVDKDQPQFGKPLGICSHVGLFKPIICESLCCCCCRKNKVYAKQKTDHDTYHNFGLGVTVYLKSLKSLMIMFFFFSVISLPSYLLYYYGGDGTVDYGDSKTFFSVLTMGNLGQVEQVCSQEAYTDTQDTELEVFCPFGHI